MVPSIIDVISIIFQEAPILLLVLGLLLLGFISTSLWLAGSGYVEGRTHLGWILLLAFTAVYIEFCIRWFQSFESVGASVLGFVTFALILATQGPLLLELISRSLMPDPSRNLKLIKSYTEAERKVADDDLAGAIEEYEKVIAQDPDDMTARFRLADLSYQNKDYRKTVQVYQELVSLKVKLDAAQYCSALMRLSEIHAHDLADNQNARKYLEAIIEEYPEVKFAGYAKDRLQNLTG